LKAGCPREGMNSGPSCQGLHFGYGQAFLDSQPEIV
jgi:hypothetical protein